MAGKISTGARREVVSAAAMPVIVVNPVAVRSLDQINLAGAQVALQRFLPLDRLLSIGEILELDGLVHAIPAGELRADPFLVAADTVEDIVCNAD